MNPYELDQILYKLASFVILDLESTIPRSFFEKEYSGIPDTITLIYSQEDANKYLLELINDVDSLASMLKWNYSRNKLCEIFKKYDWRYANRNEIKTILESIVMLEELSK